MLLPSALPCDLRRASRFTPIRLFPTPPPSDDDTGLPGNGLLGTCLALQSLLGSPAPPSRRSKSVRLQSPLTFQPSPPSPALSRKKRTKSPSTKPPSPRARATRGANKRRRNTFEEDHMDLDSESDNRDFNSRSNLSTPKRARHLPYELPLGLSQSDFYSLNSPPVTQSPSPARNRQLEPSFSLDPDAALPSIEESDELAPENTSTDQLWSSDDDQRLVELVLEKFQLSQHDWDECARRMGKDHASVGQRWQALLGEGNVGLRRGRRMVRSRIHKDWM
ncbi:hypothetical protein BDV19DRAFT_368673 [Aspergillus venezuelensis]